VAQAVGTFSGDALMDGEQVRSRYFVFDLMELNGRDLRPMAYLQRRAFLEALVASGSQNLVEVVPTMNDPAVKRAELERLRKAGAEGVVFKRIHSSYQPGRPASGGDQVKLKFYETASVVVLAVNDKRSVLMGVYPAPVDHPRAAGMPPKFQGHAEIAIPVGNVTIPANHKIPRVGARIEVRMLYAYPTGSIYQPTYLGERTDVDAPECHAAQLKFRVVLDDDEEDDLAS
jgi:bifunctional non-homologous end joining protein LigD